MFHNKIRHDFSLMNNLSYYVYMAINYDVTMYVFYAATKDNHLVLYQSKIKTNLLYWEIIYKNK